MQFSKIAKSFYTHLLIFLEGVGSPLPTDALALTLSGSFLKRFLSCTLTSSLGCIAGYGLGRFYEPKAAIMLEAIQKVIFPELDWTDLKAHAISQAKLILVAKSITPLPTCIVTVTMGTLACPFNTFCTYATLGRAFKYFSLFALGKVFKNEAQMLVTAMGYSILIALSLKLSPNF